MLKWKYGDYQFVINPNSKNAQVSLEGDEARTLTGALISQPTALVEKYQVSAMFFQPRNRVVTRTSLSNATLIEFFNKQAYLLNKVSDSIDVYSGNLISKTNTISLSAVPNKNYLAFDVQVDAIWVICNVDAANDIVYKLTNTGGLITSFNVAKSVDATGLKVFAGYIWVLRRDGTMNKFRSTDYAIGTAPSLPYGVNYNGMTSDGNYLIAGNNDNGHKIYHFDSTGKVINMIYSDSMGAISDIAYDGIYFYTISNGTIETIIGNTVEVDLYRLINEIKTKKFVTLVDDMGVTMRCHTSDFVPTRRMGFEHMYEVSMTIQKVNRG